MKFLQKIFGTVESVTYWRDRAEKLESKLEGERQRNRIRECELLDEIIKLAGGKPIFDSSENKADLTGERAAVRKKLKDRVDAEEAKQLEIERKAYVQNAVRRGISADTAAQYFDEHKNEILASQI